MLLKSTEEKMLVVWKGFGKWGVTACGGRPVFPMKIHTYLLKRSGIFFKCDRSSALGSTPAVERGQPSSDLHQFWEGETAAVAMGVPMGRAHVFAISAPC